MSHEDEIVTIEIRYSQVTFSAKKHQVPQNKQKKIEMVRKNCCFKGWLIKFCCAPIN